MSKGMTIEMSPSHARATLDVFKGMTIETSLYHTGVTEFANIN